SGMCKMMFYEKKGEYMRLLAFVINSNYREKGYGTILLKESEMLAIQLGCKIITLNSGDRVDRDGAHIFYKRNGFVNKSSGFSKNLYW
ncbi:GNAT family N-acetyltransferase, partial [Staphylococcus casei]